jgi:hypothetical protein
MNWLQPRSLSVLSLSILFEMPLALYLSAQAQLVPLEAISIAPFQISLDFRVPDRSAPSSTVGGATRGGCSEGSKSLVALSPKNYLGLTTAKRPSFFFFAPGGAAKQAEFLLLSDDDTVVVYEQKVINLPNTAGIVRYDLPETAPTLAADKRYHWYITLSCTGSGVNGNPSAEGWVERTELPALTKTAETADLKNLPELYAKSGIWYETVAALVQLRQKFPNNPKVMADWQDLLKSAGLEAVMQEPIANQENF